MMLKRITSVFLIFSFLLSLMSCAIDNRYTVGSYEENNNENIKDWDDITGDVTDWGNVDVQSFSDSDIISSYVYSAILFENITDEYASVTTIELDYKSNGQYFDGERVYQLVGKQFDLNPLIAKFAIGTGVIVVCVILNVVTAGTSTPVACFIAGAAKGAMAAAAKGAAMGAAMGAISSAIKSKGEWDETLYGTVEGASDGYMWGAVFGAISGGLSSEYCFAGDTLVLTENGYKNISSIDVGEKVLSYDMYSESYEYMPVSNVIEGTAVDTVKISVGEETIESTTNHPYMTQRGWIAAGELTTDDLLLSCENEYKKIVSIEHEHHETNINTYNLTISDNHTYLVGQENIVVHNKCNINSKYAGKTKYFDEGSELAKKYPNGVSYSNDGFARFEPYASKKITFKAGELNGKYNHDFSLANKAAGFGTTPNSTPAGFTWHHVEDGKTLLLVPQDIHNAARHTGGASILASLVSGG